MLKRNSGIVRVSSNREILGKPITYSDTDDVYIFYTSQGKLVQSKTYEEAYAKWLLTKETD